MYSSINRILLTNAGGTFNIDVLDNRETMLIGNVTLAANVDVAQSGTPTVPTTLVCKCRGAITLSGNTVTIFGKTLSSQQALKGCIVESFYDLTLATWITTIYESTTNSPKVNQGVTQTTLVNGGGTITLVAGRDKRNQTLVGSPTLAASYVIQGTGVADGDEFFIKYSAAAVIGGNTITIFGVTLSDLQSLNGNLTVHAQYDLANAAWIVQMYQNPNVSLAGELEIVVVPVSFEAGEQIIQNVVFPYPAKVIKAWSCVTTDIAGTDNGTIAVLVAGVPVGSSPITMLSGSPAGTHVSLVLTAPNSFIANQGLQLTTAKTTAGGRCNVTLFIQRL